MLKYTLAVIAFSMLGALPTDAQEKAASCLPDKEKPKITSFQRPLLMSISIGPNFNTGGSDYPEWFGSRPQVVTQFDWRTSVAFARHWCAYINIGASFFGIQTDNSGENIVTAFFDELFLGISKIKPSINAGISHLTEKGRWQFMPRAGIGVASTSNTKRTKKINGKEYKTEIDRSPIFFNAGTTIGYRTSNICSFIVDINYRCPIQSCKATYTILDTPPVTEIKKSRSWANDLSISVGLQVQTELKKKKK